jgi:hypothetical protein
MYVCVFILYIYIYMLVCLQNFYLSLRLKVMMVDNWWEMTDDGDRDRLQNVGIFLWIDAAGWLRRLLHWMFGDLWAIWQYIWHLGFIRVCRGIRLCGKKWKQENNAPSVAVICWVMLCSLSSIAVPVIRRVSRNWESLVGVWMNCALMEFESSAYNAFIRRSSLIQQRFTVLK